MVLKACHEHSVYTQFAIRHHGFHEDELQTIHGRNKSILATSQNHFRVDVIYVLFWSTTK